MEPEEREQLEKEARSEGLDYSQYLRHLIITNKKRKKNYEEKINEN